MKTVIHLLSFAFAILLFSCVGPPELDDGLVKNLPSVVNTPDAFTFLLKADNYTFDETYDLSLSLVDSTDIVVTTILVTGFVRGDSTQISVLNALDTPLLPFMVDGDYNYVSIDSAKTYSPKKVNIRGKNFTGELNFILAKRN
ncbi:MAG: hypothetical protein GXO92_00490 [FCB group bacterium]|nr:hypothetical protein [FCB group bacterium]